MPLLPIALAVAAVGGGAIALARRFHGNKPDGATFFAGRHSDRRLLNLAHSVERHVDGRMVAQKHPGATVR